MITRIEISGFKTFTDFAVDLAPLSVIAGANASGKSNLLDAIEVIRGLATGKRFGETLHGRGVPTELFAKYGEGRHAHQIKFAVELLMPRTMRTLLGGLPASGTRYRYEVWINYPSLNHFPDSCLIAHEELRYLNKSEDTWADQFLSPVQRSRLVRYPDLDPVENPIFTSRIRRTEVTWFEGASPLHSDQTMLSRLPSTKDIAVEAVQEWFDNLASIDLADPNNFSNHAAPERRKNIVLSQFAKLGTETSNLRYVNSRATFASKDIRSLEVEIDQYQRITVNAIDRFGNQFLSESLSEGTRRALSIAALLMNEDPQHTYLVEEPENGVDPRAMRRMVNLLSDIVADFDEDESPFNQIICTTHSPVLLDLVVGLNSRKAIAYLAKRNTVARNIADERTEISKTSINPIHLHINKPVPESRAERSTLSEAKQYLRTGSSQLLHDV